LPNISGNKNSKNAVKKEIKKGLALCIFGCMHEDQICPVDISGNTKIGFLGIDRMPSLTKVCVWVMPFSVQSWTEGSDVSPSITISSRYLTNLAGSVFDN